MPKISLKKDYTDGNVLYGKDLNPNFELIETVINENTSVLPSDIDEIKGQLEEINSNLEANYDTSSEVDTKVSSSAEGTLNSSKGYTDEKLVDYAKTEAIPTKISQLSNDDFTVKDKSYVHTDNNYTNEDKNKLASLNNYELPTATSDVLGGVKVGEGLSMDMYNRINLSVATTSKIGGIKAGDGVSIESDGTLNVVNGGGSTGEGIPTLVGTEEKPIILYVPGSTVPFGLSYISGYTKDIPNGEVNNNYDGLLLYTLKDGAQIIGPKAEENDDAFSSTKANLIFWFRKSTINGASQLSQPFVKFSANDIITASEQGYVTPKAVYDYVGALSSLNTSDKTSIVNAINELAKGGSGTPGEDGATFTPSISEDGTLSWTNDKSLPNPDPVNIKGPQGEPGKDGEQGPAGQDGEQGPQGEPGVGVPIGGTIGQILSKFSNDDYDTTWIDAPSGGGGSVIELEGTQGEPIDMHYVTNPGVYHITGYVKNFPSSIDNYSDSITKNTNTFSLGSNSVLALINKSDARYNCLYFTEYNNSLQLLTTFGNIQKDEDSNSYFAITFKHINLNMESNKSTLTGSYGLATASTVRAMIMTATGISNTNPLSNLQTTDKSSLVAAINELKAEIDALKGSSS